ncbi:hypothetical protein [Saccharibacillus qingshengii]|uniref:hypothetical protein n=1 Tax=Saccharibacillus qingshengii TaxID=1763540 RepID=UPI001555E4EF|nr:hypothetical protein [Saccharibacillus qingshengii]
MPIMNVLPIVARKINQTGIPYVIGGSMAAVINGCTSIQPNDIDVILQNPVDVEKLISAFEGFLGEPQPTENPDMSTWISTKSHRVLTFEDPSNHIWTFARLLIQGVKVEIANIKPAHDIEYVPETGIWENGPAIWPYIKQVTMEDTPIPVLPLEIQLETNLNRGLEDRIASILDVFRRKGYDAELLKFSLSKENHLKMKEILDES